MTSRGACDSGPGLVRPKAYLIRYWLDWAGKP